MVLLGGGGVRLSAVIIRHNGEFEDCSVERWYYLQEVGRPNQGIDTIEEVRGWK